MYFRLRDASLRKAKGPKTKTKDRSVEMDARTKMTLHVMANSGARPSETPYAVRRRRSSQRDKTSERTEAIQRSASRLRSVRNRLAVDANLGSARRARKSESEKSRGKFLKLKARNSIKSQSRISTTCKLPGSLLGA